ncbi:hypothetical protein NFI96_004607, partial [Prochilodus magdalenae]
LSLRVDHGGEERMKPGIKKYSCELTLDPNTVNRRLSLCEENRKVVWAREEQSYPDHPERFDGCEQVLCRESLTGRCYWEAEWSGYVYIAVTYKGIRRKGVGRDWFGGYAMVQTMSFLEKEGLVLLISNHILHMCVLHPGYLYHMYVACSPALTLAHLPISSCVRNALPEDQSKCGVCDQIQTDPVFLEESKKQDYCQPVDEELHRVVQRHKTSMKKKYESLFEGFKTHQNKTLLNRIYTQLYILEGESEGVNEEHEVLQIEKKPRNQHWQDTPINCSDIFKPVQCTVEKMEEDNTRALITEDDRHEERTEDNSPQVQKLRSVMTKGIAGIGKTVSVQKFILDWAEGKANQDVDLMFVFQFRELNLIKDHQYSLQGLLCDFHPELKDLDTKTYDECKMVFIFDGLDESRIPLNFLQSEKVTDITKVSSVDLLMTHLIKGELLPSALIWITSRPAAANQIPSQYIKRVTEIQGFNDPQKEEYFRKRISDQDQAHSVISHIKKTRSLHIMCHIPVFCWISATVLQHIMKQGHTAIPKTLTAMYSHFLWTQTIMRSEKYEDRGERSPEDLLGYNRKMLLKLAELAFKQLMKGNVMFYEEDLRECGIDVTEASVYSGICTEIFREESVLHQRKVYCFVHLSFQEFLAALYVFHSYVSKNMEELQCLKTRDAERSDSVSLEELLRGAVRKALESKSGHLDLFVRFLMGISLESNQQLLKDLLTQTVSNSESIKKTIQYIKDVIQSEDLPSGRSINLFLCLTEMNDQSLSSSIQEYLKSEKSSEKKLSPAECLALAYMLVTSEEVLDELNLKNYRTSEEGYLSLIPAVSNCKKAVLAGCKLTMNSCETICAALKSTNSPLKELDLSSTGMQDSEINLLSAGLKSSNCKLEVLRLAGCKPAMNSCETLCAALKSTNSHLKELDLSYTGLQDSEINLLSAALKSSKCKLKILRLAGCKLTMNFCETLSAALKSANSPLKELDLSNSDLQDSGVNLLSAGLKSLNCKMEIFRLSGCMVTEEGCSYLASALNENPSHLKELDLSYNHPGDTGVKMLSARLETLRVDHVGEEWIKPGLKKCSDRRRICMENRLQTYRAEPPDPSCVSMKSNNSMEEPFNFSNERSSTDLSCVRNASPEDQSKCEVCDQIQTDAVCMKESMKQDYRRPVDDVLHRVVQRLKASMKNRYESLFEGFKTDQNKTLLNRIYTQLYIIEGESEGVNEEHEVLQIEKKLWNQHWQDTPINCLDIFKPVRCTVVEMEEDNIRILITEDDRHEERTEDNSPQVQKLRSVMTKGIAGIGKTVSVQKFILDWAEGKANQDVDLMFVFQFRELNLIKDHQYSLQGLLCDFHPELKDLDTETYDECKMVFIFDGLDESRIPLNFLQSEKVTDITKVSSVDLLMTNLIKRELLPSALIWITSRPAAANQIPSQYINRVTEIQGFNDPQKEEYFRKRISDQDQAHSVISHIKKTRSLHIMCHIPVFCWISATVLQHIMKQGHKEIPKTLTAMYSHFLWTQTIMRSEKYEDRGERSPEDLLGSNRKMLLKLAELAFKQLMKCNVVFYEEDLRECSIDVTEASVYSGICTEIFREESMLYQRKVYCFVHLSFQEFLAALYVFHCYVNKNIEELQCLKTRKKKWSYRVSLEELLRGAVRKALKSQNGHLDLFLRFLLGISLESNQQLLKNFLILTVSSSKSIKKTVQCIKDIIETEDLPSDRSINLLLCLTEMNDQSLSSSIQEYLKSEKCSEKKLSPAECLALAYMLVTSEEVLDELNLKNYRTSLQGYLRLIPAVSNCRKAVLADCKLTMNSFETICAALKSTNSPLKELDLSNTDPQNSGVQLLSAGLKSSNCKLEILSSTKVIQLVEQVFFGGEW